jgi:50S ribosomal protein L16 3-hydroxylase
MMPAALQGFRSPLEADELAGLACEPDVESRLVMRRDSGFELTHGPFNKAMLRSLPDKSWSLLVQDTEKHLPELAGILEVFGFIPNWRVEDLMISCAAPEGSVGPHVDAYDVFLVQGLGRRRWQIGLRDAQAECIEDSELRLLKHFQPVAEWIAEPGDVLYLPPGVPHHGIAVECEELCMTYSVGFRAPSQAEMLQDLAEFLSARGESLRYSDADMDCSEAAAPGISRKAIRRVRQLLKSATELDEDTLAEWFGKLISEPKAWMRAEAPGQIWTADELVQRLSDGDRLRRHGMAQLTCWQSVGRLILFVDGSALEAPLELASLVASLCKSRNPDLTANMVKQSPPALALITELLNMGTLEFCNDDAHQ